MVSFVPGLLVGQRKVGLGTHAKSRTRQVRETMLVFVLEGAAGDEKVEMSGKARRERFQVSSVHLRLQKIRSAQLD